MSRNQEQLLHQVKKQRVKMIMRLVTQQWAKALYSQRAVGLYSNPHSVAESDGLYLEGGVHLNGSMIRKIQEHLDFAERFFRVRHEKFVKALSFVLITQHSGMRQPLTLHISPEIDISFNVCSIAANRYSNSYIAKRLSEKYILPDKSRRDDMFVATDLSPRPLLWSPVGTVCSPVSEEHHAVPTGLSREKGEHPRGYTHPVLKGLKKRNITFQTASQRLSETSYAGLVPIFRVGALLRNALRPTHPWPFPGGDSVTQGITRDIPMQGRENEKGGRMLILQTASNGKEPQNENVVQKILRRKELYTLKDVLSNTIVRLNERIHNINIPHTVTAHDGTTYQPTEEPPVILTFTKRAGREESVQRVSPSLPMELVTKNIQRVEKQINREEIEKNIHETVVKKVDKTIETSIQKKLRVDSEYTRRLTENIYAQLFNRIVLERERVGGL